jgi:exosortase
MNVTAADARPRTPMPLLALLVPLGCLAWAFWGTFADLARTWNANPNYSHGFLVPGFAALLLWLRRGRLDRAAAAPSWWGLPLVALGLGLRLYGGYFYYVWLEQVALLPCVAGLVLVAGGRAAWRWAWPAVLFLAFMVPLPYRLEIALSGPLQRLATVSSTFLMQVLGLPALAEGNVILLNDSQINIVEACSGLRMLMVFFALSTAVALLARRPLLDRALLLASAVPIAVVVNIVRVAATGVLHELVDGETANAFFHDAAGWFMMPLALAILGAELKLLSALLPAPDPAARRPVRTPVVRRTPVARPARARPVAPRGRPAAGPDPVAANPSREA